MFQGFRDGGYFGGTPQTESGTGKVGGKQIHNLKPQRDRFLWEEIKQRNKGVNH